MNNNEICAKLVNEFLVNNQSCDLKEVIKYVFEKSRKEKLGLSPNEDNTEHTFIPTTLFKEYIEIIKFLVKDNINITTNGYIVYY